MINCDGWLIDPMRLLAVSAVVEENGVYWFSLQMICGEEHLICRCRQVDILDLQTRFLRALSERGTGFPKKDAGERFWGWQH
jgi:hypothetical protein